ncbi:MAG: hypothetical protein H6811_01120 [Phycisphaeraceae bacterium]|nr:hypothetical protein [Phycisphaeraceae bacterium]
MRCLATVWLVVLVGFLGSAAHAQDVIRHTGFRIDIPLGWTRMPRAELNRIISDARQASGDYSLMFVDGFRRADTFTDTPYMLVQTIQMDDRVESATEEEMLDAVAALTGADVMDQVRDIGIETRFGRATFDKKRMRFAFVGEMYGPDGDVLRLFTVGYFGKRRVVSLHFYELADEFDQALPKFKEFAEAFRWDGGEQLGLRDENGLVDFDGPDAPPAREPRGFENVVKGATRGDGTDATGADGDEEAKRGEAIRASTSGWIRRYALKGALGVGAILVILVIISSRRAHGAPPGA